MSAPRTTASRSLVAILAALMLLAALPASSVLAAAANDNRSDAIDVVSLPFTDAQDTSDATQEADDPSCFGSGPTVWYRFTPVEPVDVIAHTFGSDYDTTLSVYVDEGEGQVLQIACNDDFESLQSLVSWHAQAGVTYLVMVGAFSSGPGGQLAFALEEGFEPPPPDPIDVSVDILGATLSRATGQVTVEASIACSVDAYSFGFSSVRQRAGRTWIQGYAFGEFICGPEPTTVSMTTFHESGIFAGGHVEVFVEVEAYRDNSWGWSYDTDTVRMRMAR